MQQSKYWASNNTIIFISGLSNIVLTNYSNQGWDPAAFIEPQLSQSCADKKGWL